MVTIFAVDKPMAMLVKVVATIRFVVDFETGVSPEQDRVEGLFLQIDLFELVARYFKFLVK